MKSGLNEKTEMLMDPIKIDSGYISGTMLGEPGNEVHIYRGVPYAAPPVGDLRWRPPQPVAPWMGIRQCIEFSPIAPQSTLGERLSFPQTLPSSEDCLYLNILTPVKKATDRLPVMVWLHGGGYQGSSGSSALTNSARLPQHGVVIVNINMRLNTIGLLAHPLLSRESPRGVSGNYMFLDMIAALQWVQKNIDAFGGDPENITIFGQSGGGARVANLMASPLARGLFHRAICESGTSVGLFSPGKPLKELEAMGEKFFAKLGVNKEKDQLAAARALPWEKIIEADIALSQDLAMFRSAGLWEAAVDGLFLPDTPTSLFKKCEQNAGPLIVCANLGELTGPGVPMLHFLIPGYVDMLSAVSKTGNRGYACIFDQVPGKWKQDGCVSAHGMERGYVFGDWDNTTGNWPKIYSFARPSGAKSPDPGLTDIDRKVSQTMMTLWTQFAKTGNPSAEGLLEWPSWEPAGDQYLYMAEVLEIKSGFSKVAQK